MTEISDVNIRLAYKEDIGGMYAVEKASFAMPWSYESFAENFYNAFSVYVLAEDAENGIIGFAGMQMIFDEAHIMNVAVKKEFRRKGVADGMMAFIKSYAKEKGVLRVFLEVRTSNLPAQALYAKHGFSVMTVRKKYYSDTDEDALIMISDL